MNALLLSAIMGVVMMFGGIFIRSKAAIRALAIGGLALTLVAALLDFSGIRFFDIDTTGMMEFGRLPLFFSIIILASTLIFFLLSAKDMDKVGINYSDYFALIFFICCGMILVLSFQSLLILFLGIEIISIPLYILTGSDKKNLKSNEASLKYFLLGAFSTGLMLMGITLLYGQTGSFELVSLGSTEKGAPIMVMGGMALLLFSMSFKVSAAPFHFWTPDVYDGAPSVFTAFMATIVKGAVFISFLRLFNNSFGEIHESWKLMVAIITALTLFIGNLTAVFQQSVKRMLAYSSIAQAGFMMMAILALNNTAVEGLVLYVPAYTLATLGLFAILIKMKDYSFEGFNGLAARHPLVAATAVIFLLSLAGIPLTAGFLAKFYMLKALVNAGGLLWLVIFAVLMAAISVYYYFRVVQAMYFKSGESQELEMGKGFQIALVMVAALIILLGIFPGLLLNWIYF